MSISLDHPHTCPIIDEVRDAYVDLIAESMSDIQLLMIEHSDATTIANIKHDYIHRAKEVIEPVRTSAEEMRASADAQLTETINVHETVVDALYLRIANLEARVYELGDN